MISKEEFLNKVQTDIFPDLIQTEKGRIKALFQGGILILIAIAFAFVFREVLFDLDNKDGCKAVWTITTLIALAGTYIWERFKNKQKEKFSPVFLNFLGNLSCDSGTITESLFRYSCLFDDFTSMHYDDCISGVFENTKFSVMELKLIAGSGKHQHIAFKGICIDVPMKTNISGYTLLYNTKIPKKVPLLQKLKLEDVSFSKNYQIFSDSQIEARVLLTPAFMDRLNNLKKYFKNKRIDVAFFGNHAVFAIHTNQDLFESYSMFRKATNIKTYARYYDEIRSIYDLTEILHINNGMIQSGFSFNKELYKKISSIKKSKEKNGVLICLGLFFLFCILVFIICWFSS